ncbi:MAG: dephospho-CoA kinase [Myxococcota bacterium]
MRRIGLTGGIASGKSTVSTWLREAGVPVLDSDTLARQAVAPGSSGLAELVAQFGEKMLLPDLSLNREALGALVFRDAEARVRLNAIVHPRVRALTDEALQRLEAAGETRVVLDIPLLYEVRDPTEFETVVVVYVDAETQLQRLMKRNNLSEADARARINSQLSLEEKKARADVVIDNGGSFEETRRQVEVLLQGLLAR